jgi:hypothetical protein
MFKILANSNSYFFQVLQNKIDLAKLKMANGYYRIIPLLCNHQLLTNRLKQQNRNSLYFSLPFKRISLNKKLNCTISPPKRTPQTALAVPPVARTS